MRTPAMSSRLRRLRRLRHVACLLAAGLAACSTGGGAEGPSAPRTLSDAAPPGVVDADDFPAADAGADAASDAATDAAAPPLGQLGSGRFALEVRGAPFSLVLVRDGEPLATVRSIDVALADTEAHAADRHMFFDPAKPGTYHVEWRTLAPAGEPGPDGLPTRLAAGDVTAALRLTAGEEGRVTVEVLPEPHPRLVQMRLVLDAPAGEEYYGLGELFDRPTHRGLHRPMHMAPDLQSESLYTENHVTVPLLVSTAAWGVFVEDRRPADFDVAASDGEHIVITYETKALRFHLFGADRPIDVLPHYIGLTGQPARPAEWAFGGWIWRNENRDAQEVLDDVATLRRLDLPMSGLWLDRPWSTDLNSFVMDPAKFPDPAGLVAAVHAAGLRMAVWASPYLEPSSADLYAQALENDWFVHTPEGWIKPFEDATFVDLTNPAAATFFSGLVSAITELGIEGFKLDYGEDIQVGVGPVALAFDFFSGETERTMHHGVALPYHRPFAALTGGDAHGFILSRAGTYGDQTLTTTIWPGDLCNGFEHPHERRHVGGLPAAISGGLSLSASGYPFFASDTGGYRHGRATKAVFLRWLAYSALGSVLQTGGSAQHNPWDFEPYDTGRPEDPESRFDAETLAIYRDFARLYIRLHAYRHPYNEDAHATGRPVTRPLGLMYPELGVHPPAEYLLGDALLAAPATDATGAVEIALPAGEWYEWYSDERVVGPTTLQRVVPLDRVSLWVRGGAIVPLLRETVDTLAPATDADVDSYANDPGVLTVRLYPTEGPQTFDTLGNTHIEWDGHTARVTGDHFTGYVFERHQAGQAPERREVGPGPQSVDWAPVD